MSNIKPFRAVYYNPDKIKDLNKVFCPPYDVITEEQQNDYYQLSPYNYIRIILGKDKANDDKSNNKYTRSKKFLEDWLKKEVMSQDKTPSVYFYRQDYKVKGQKNSRLGFISLMELQDESDSRVVPHEKTHRKAIDDRLKLWRTVNSNLSAIFVCYSDKQKRIDKIFTKNVSVQKPVIDVQDNDKVRHLVWRLNDPELIKEINHAISGQHLFIADGHHRYQVACEFRKLKRDRKTNVNGQEPFNYVMTYFTNIDSQGLQIFPMHRVIKKLTKKLDFLEDYFRIDKVKTVSELLILLAKAGRNEHAFGLYTRDDILLLRLKNKMLINKHIKEGSSEYKSLDATILKTLVLDKIGIPSEEIVYTKDLEASIDSVERKEMDAVFVMNPVKINELKAIALNGEKMPPKTTYFYPKVLSGLTTYKID